MSLPQLLLGLLRSPAPGYELKQQLDALYSHAWNADLPQIYRTLIRMERDGWLAATPEPSDRGPERRVYLGPRLAMLSWRNGCRHRRRVRRTDGRHWSGWPSLVRLRTRMQRSRPSAPSEHKRRRHWKGSRKPPTVWAAVDVSYPDCDNVHDFYLQLTLDARIQELQGRVAWASRCMHRIAARIRVSERLR